MSARYFVYEDRTLIYHIKDTLFGILASNIFKGGKDPMGGPFHIFDYEKDSLKEATIADFESYRVCHRGHLI